jgi:beta-lactamase class A
MSIHSIKINLSCLAIMMLISISTMAQKTDKKLQKKIEAMVSQFNGDIGVYAIDLKKNKVVSINADTVFPTASMVKIPILVGVMDKIEKGELKYEQPLQYSDSLLYAGVDILGSFKNSEKIALNKVIMLMLTMSDNTASLWLQSLAGTGSRINELMKELGLEHTRVNSRTPGREANRTMHGWGQTTPFEMAMLMKKIVEGQVISNEKSQKMLRMLGRNFWDDVSISQIPTDVFVASKNGAVNQSRSEILFVNGRGARYIFSICTKNNKDQGWGESNEAWVLARKISALLWEHYSGK